MPPNISTPTPRSPRTPIFGATVYVAPALASTDVNDRRSACAPVIVFSNGTGVNVNARADVELELAR